MATHWKILIIVGIVILAIIIISFVYLMLISKKDGEVNPGDEFRPRPYGQDPRYNAPSAKAQDPWQKKAAPKDQDPWRNRGKDRPEDHIHWENYGYDENGNRRF